MRILRIRHRTAPWPTGCRWCGALKSEHHPWMPWYTQIPGKVYHTWTPPTDAQYALRMRVRIERIRRNIA